MHLLEITPYVAFNDFNFADSYQSIKSKLSKFKIVHDGPKVEMGKEYPSLYIQDIELLIVFVEGGERVRYFEIDNDVHHGGMNLHREPLSKLRLLYKKLDENLEKLNDGIKSPLFGIQITKSEIRNGNSVLVYSNEYTNEPPISEDDIINYFMK